MAPVGLIPRTADPSILTAIFVSWAAGCLLLGAVLVRRAPAITAALIGSVVGALGVFVSKNAESRSGVPFECAMGATAGLMLVVSSAPCSPLAPHRRDTSDGWPWS